MARYAKAGDVEAFLSDRDESGGGVYAVKHTGLGMTAVVHVGPEQYNELERMFDENELFRDGGEVEQMINKLKELSERVPYRP